MSWEGRALAGGWVPGGAAWAGLDSWALAGASVVVVDLRGVANRGVEQASVQVEGQVARANREGRALASGVVECGSARARSDRRASALASELVVNLRGGAAWEHERAGRRGEGQTARVSRVGRALAGAVIPDGVALAVGWLSALTLASVGVVSLAGRAGRDDKGAGRRVVGQEALVSRVGRALAGCRVPGGAAEAGLDLFAVALARGVVQELSAETEGRVGALAVAVVVELLVARAGVRALALAGGRVVDLGWVGAGGVDASQGAGAELERSSADAVAAVVVVVRALRRDDGAKTGGWADRVARLERQALTAGGGGGAAALRGDAGLGGVAPGSAVRAELDARSVVGGRNVVLLADEAEVVETERGRALVDNAERDQWQASLEVTGRVVAWSAESAGLVEGDVGLAVRDDAPALGGVWGELVVDGALRAEDRGHGVVLGDVADAKLDVWQAGAAVLGEVVARVADATEVAVRDVGQAPVDVVQTEVSV